jgi:hypothetical protein
MSLSSATQVRASAPRSAPSSSVLAQMSPEERLRASRDGGFSHAERALWTGHYPEEVPLVNDEVEWIALGLADLD